MTGSTITFSGTTFPSVISRAFPSIPGLKTMVFFGTGWDANEANRVAGGPALSVMAGGAPVHAANYISLGSQPHPTPTRLDAIDTNNLRDASWLASGWTYMACARNPMPSNDPQFGNYSVVFFEQIGTTGGTNGSGIGLRGTNNQIILFRSGINAGGGTLTLAQPVSNWHIVASQVAAGAGAGAAITGWDFTEVQGGQSVASTLATALTTATAMSPHFGAGPNDSSVGQGAVDIAWGMIAQAVLPQVTMAAIAASARQILGRRGIAC